MYCISCKKNNVIPENYRTGNSETEEEVLYHSKQTINIDNQVIYGGLIKIVSAGYGSTHDGDQFIVAICDECLDKNLKDGTILYYGNYIFANGNDIEEEKERSKKTYRRRKNLDGLV